ATETRNGVRYAKLGLANEKPYRKTEQGAEILGAAVAVFRKAPDGHDLVRWVVYADGQSQLDSAGELVPLREIAQMFAGGLLATAVPNDSWVTIAGLGRFRTGKGYWYVDAGERIREAEDLHAILAGQPGAIQQCIASHKEYDREPTKARREALRQAYEAVPEHLRRYCGDMDSKDGPIRHILYGDEP